MRTIIAMLIYVITGFSAVWAGEAVHSRELIRLVGGIDSKFKTFRSEECGGYQAVLSSIEKRFSERTEQDVFAAEGNYAYTLAIEVMHDAVKQGTMHQLCLAMVYASEISETNLLVILTPIGDFVVGYDAAGGNESGGAAFTPWSKVDQEGWGFDTLAFADFTAGLTTKVYEEMKEMPIISVSEHDPKA